MNASDFLDGCPYQIDTDRSSGDRFRSVYVLAERTRKFAEHVRQRLAQQASEVVDPLRRLLRSELVAESNRIEGYDWTPQQVAQVVAAHRELMSLPVHSFIESMKQDPRVFEALGLYRAHELADEWADTGRLPMEFEIRGLHGLITAGESFAGKYKEVSNTIGGSTHRTIEPWDVPVAMKSLVDWWHSSAAEPVLKATVVHAWLTHIHPFIDGNGRVARLLANVALTQSGFPPLILSSGADRGQYYDALALSDDGDILPLYSLFTQVVRRTTRTMNRAGYAREVLENRLFVTVADARAIWEPFAISFQEGLAKALSRYGWVVRPMGLPSITSFWYLTADYNMPFGNGWFLKVLDEGSQERWLLWFGHNTLEAKHIVGSGRQSFPSVFFSVRDYSGLSQHRFFQVLDSDSVPVELIINPLDARPALLRWKRRVAEDLGMEEACQLVAVALA